MTKNSMKMKKTIIYFILFALLFLVGCTRQSEKNISLPTVPTTPTAGALEKTTYIHNPLSTPTPYILQKNDSVEPSPIETITQNGITVNIYWVYADHARIAIAYEVRGVEYPDGFAVLCPVRSMTINISPGNLQDTYLSYGGDTEHLVSSCFHQSDGSFFLTHNFYLPEFEKNTEFDLTVDISVGGMFTTTSNGIRADIPDYGVFHFQQKVPNNGNLTIEHEESVEKDGITIQMHRIEINPSIINAYMCFSYENLKGWHPELSLSFRDKKIKAEPLSIFRTDLAYGATRSETFTSHRCYRFGMPTDRFEILSNLPDQIKITVENITTDALEAATQDDCDDAREKVQQSYSDLDFNCFIENTDDGGYGVFLDIINVPNGMERIDAQIIAEEGFVDVVNGPWDFSIPIP